MDMNKLKTKIAALIAKAESTTNEHEADAFMAKATELMNEHQLQSYELNVGDPMGRFDGMTGTTSSPTWQRHLLCAVAVYYGATTVRQRVGKEFTIVIVGAESARITTELMHEYILQQVKDLGKASANEMGLKPQAAIRRVANSLVFRLHEIIQERDEQNKERVKKNIKFGQSNVKSSGTDLIIAKSDALKAYMKDEFPRLRAGIARARNVNATSTRAAAGVSLNRQTTGGRAAPLQLN